MGKNNLIILPDPNEYPFLTDEFRFEKSTKRDVTVPTFDVNRRRKTLQVFLSSAHSYL